MLSLSRSSTDSSSKICGRFVPVLLKRGAVLVSAINFGISARIALALHMPEFLLQSPKRESRWICVSGQRQEGSFSCFCDLKPYKVFDQFVHCI